MLSYSHLTSEIHPDQSLQIYPDSQIHPIPQITVTPPNPSSPEHTKIFAIFDKTLVFGTRRFGIAVITPTCFKHNFALHSGWLCYFHTFSDMRRKHFVFNLLKVFIHWSVCFYICFGEAIARNGKSRCVVHHMSTSTLEFLNIH